MIGFWALLLVGAGSWLFHSTLKVGNRKWKKEHIGTRTCWSRQGRLEKLNNEFLSLNFW